MSASERLIRAADIGEPVREVEIPATEPAWTVPEPAPVPDRERQPIPA